MIAPGVDAGTTLATESGGCGCVMAGARPTETGWIFAALAIVLSVFRRSRRR